MKVALSGIAVILAAETAGMEAYPGWVQAGAAVAIVMMFGWVILIRDPKDKKDDREDREKRDVAYASVADKFDDGLKEQREAHKELMARQQATFKETLDTMGERHAQTVQSMIERCRHS